MQSMSAGHSWSCVNFLSFQAPLAQEGKCCNGSSRTGWQCGEGCLRLSERVRPWRKEKDPEDEGLDESGLHKEHGFMRFDLF